jgi:hypothetical protein
MTSAQIGNIERPRPSVVRNADILMYDEGLFCGTEQVDRSRTLASPACAEERGHSCPCLSTTGKSAAAPGAKSLRIETRFRPKY